jgi:predicted GNAT superfamily acetyltransferase
VNENFQFFQQRFERFVYIDRVITASYARRRGLARKLYEDLFARARAADHSTVGCEVNLDPPNAGSDAFHASLGFEEVGRNRLENGKTVRYLQRSL